MRTNTGIKVMTLFATICFIFLLNACPQPETGSVSREKADDENPDKIAACLSFYPGYEMIFHDDAYSLFCTTIYIPSSTETIGSFDAVIGFDPALMVFESALSYDSVLCTTEEPGRLEVKASDFELGPADNIELDAGREADSDVRRLLPHDQSIEKGRRALIHRRKLRKAGRAFHQDSSL
jgi:hypothetical protein